MVRGTRRVPGTGPRATHRHSSHSERLKMVILVLYREVAGIYMVTSD